MKAKLFLSLALVGALCCSCSSFDDINDNPNDPTVVSPKLILPNVCESAFSRGTGGMYADKMVVQTDGHNAEQFYEWNRGSFSTYNNELLQITKLKEEADRTGETVYLGLYHFFRAYYFYNLTLQFGDVPYSEALKGESDGQFAPKYDSQETVFAGVWMNWQLQAMSFRSLPASRKASVVTLSMAVMLPSGRSWSILSV